LLFLVVQSIEKMNDWQAFWAILDTCLRNALSKFNVSRPPFFPFHKELVFFF
jgi:hypothetical protein